MLITRYKTIFNRLVEPLAKSIAAAGVSPSAITITAPLLGAAACLWFLQTRQTLLFCLGIAAAGILDALDGAVARAGGRVTKFGAYLDAMCDRYFEAVVVLTVAHVTGYWILSFIVLAGALLTSYAKARAAMEVVVSNQEWPDLMERTERSAVYLAGLGASVLLPWRPLGHDLFWWTLAALAVLTHATVVQRLLRARRLISTRS